MAEPKIISLLRRRREAAGLSQLELARRVGVSRQALIAVEAGRQVPSTVLSMQLAQVLGCAVEELFQLVASDGLEVVLAPSPAAQGVAPNAGRVVVGCLEGRWVAHRLASDASLAADAVIVGARAEGKAALQLLCDRAELEDNLLLAGCAPLLGIAAQRAFRRHREARLSWLPENSARALDLLEAGLVHAAGLHLGDGRGAGGNLPVVRKRFTGRRMLLVNLTRWRQGFVVPAGNPKSIRDASDLARPGLRFVRRERGAGATRLTARLLKGAGLRESALGAGPVVHGHAAVAQLVACGAADVGVAIEGAALSAGLEFVPLSEERFDLVLTAEHAALPAVSRLIELLGGASFRAEAAQLPGYDTAISGQVTAVDAA